MLDILASFFPQLSEVGTHHPSFYMYSLWLKLVAQMLKGRLNTFMTSRSTTRWGVPTGAVKRARICGCDVSVASHPHARWIWRHADVTSPRSMEWTPAFTRLKAVVPPPVCCAPWPPHCASCLSPPTYWQRLRTGDFDGEPVTEAAPRANHGEHDIPGPCLIAY